MQTEVPYRVAKTPWPANLGSHRAIVRVETAADAVLARIPWRRRDRHPERKDIIVVDCATQQVITNRVAVRITPESGDVVFQPATMPGEYAIYYLPFNQSTHWGVGPSAGSYQPAETMPAPGHEYRQLPQAVCREIQARTAFDDATPMGLIATADETEMLLSQYPAEPFLLFPTPREMPIRMSDHLPLHWIQTGPSAVFRAEACRNEYFTFQVGVLAARQNLELKVGQASCLSLAPAAAKDRQDACPTLSLHCFNLRGDQALSVGCGQVQALWFGVDVPADIAPGEYVGKLTIQGRDIELRLTVKPEVLSDRGDSEPWRHSRLRWLDSTIGLDEEVVLPFTPLKVSGRTVSCLDRSLTFGSNGLPTRIQSRRRNILHAPVRFVVVTGGKELEFQRGAPKILKQTAAKVVWESRSKAGACSLHCRATMEFDGCVKFTVSLRADQAIQADDIRLEIPLQRDIATYLMGMGHRGGRRPERWHWRWDSSRHQDSVWIGDVQAGLRCQFLDDTYVQPAKLNYANRPLRLPRSWHNAGKGGCVISELGKDCVLINTSSGPLRLEAGEELRFDFNLLITPFKRLDTATHFRTRYFHSDAPVDDAIAAGANVINIHHATRFIPYINYPFIGADKLRAHVDEAHRRGLKTKIYYTVRELTNHTPELWALRSLGDEIFAPGHGGGHAWLQENLVTNYTPAWYHPFEDGHVDAAFAQTPSSRWHNYYLEGLAWLARHVGIDGLYLDDTDLNRVGMQRVRRILERHRPGSLIDFHAGDLYWGMYGLASTLNLYMPLLPYLDRLWIGESFEYSRTPPDFWLVEMSGIPFGVMGDMLYCELPPNPWRGALYGMTIRPPNAGQQYDPLPIWKMWDEFGIADAKMIGYWEKTCPVRTDHRDILATAYVRKNKTLVAVASWAERPATFQLKIDWKTLGLDRRKTVLRAPRIENFQQAALFRPGAEIPVAPQRGWMLILEHAN